MRQLFLTSSIHAVANHIAKKIDLSKGNLLVFIDTASEPEEGDKEWLKNDRKALVDAGFEVSDYTITGKTKEELGSFLSKFYYIYLSGGNTVYLLQQSQKTGFISVVRNLVENKGKTYIGTSAGSIITGPKVPGYLFDESKDIKVEDLNGYGFVNFTILPHWGSEDFREKYLSKRLEKAFKKNQVPLLLLTDNQYVHVRGDNLEMINTI